LKRSDSVRPPRETLRGRRARVSGAPAAAALAIAGQTLLGLKGAPPWRSLVPGAALYVLAAALLLFALARTRAGGPGESDESEADPSLRPRRLRPGLAWGTGAARGLGSVRLGPYRIGIN